MIFMPDSRRRAALQDKAAARDAGLFD